MRGQAATALQLGRRMTRRPFGVALALALTVALASTIFAATARADGDPASDYLQTNQVFFASQPPAATPAQTPAPNTAQRQLLSVVRAANRAGFGIRVAIVSSEYDLGSITALWRKPALYARFLGLELSSIFRQRLLVVMPNGYGFNWPGHPTAAVYRELGKIPVGANGRALAAAAQTAVRDLAGATGVKLGRASAAGSASAPGSSSAPGRGSAPKASGGGISGTLIGILAVALVLVGAGVALALRWRRRSAGSPLAPASSSRTRWTIPGFAALCAVAFAVPIAVLAATRHSPAASGTSTGTVVTPPPFSWPAGAHLAPAFALRDQRGQPVSVPAFRGRPVIVTFVDPLCRNLCPLEAHVLNAAVAQMPAAQRPAILAVSVDVYANKRADLLQDIRKWSLVPQWHWAVGSRAALAAAWKQYKIGVSVVTKRIAGHTINYITHSEAAYVIDPSGHERALFLWPFYPQDVVRVLRQVS
jgi:cytochrome oxidase Cu insertion factor (SCO1/SenC/PrrC family)